MVRQTKSIHLTQSQIRVPNVQLVNSAQLVPPLQLLRTVHQAPLVCTLEVDLSVTVTDALRVVPKAGPDKLPALFVVLVQDQTRIRQLASASVLSVHGKRPPTHVSVSPTTMSPSLLLLAQSAPWNKTVFQICPQPVTHNSTLSMN